MESRYLHKYKEYHGLTLEEIARKTGPNFKGWAVCMICANRPDDTLGNLVDEGLTVAEILHKNPALADCIVKYTNDFYGQIVLRVVKKAEG